MMPVMNNTSAAAVALLPGRDNYTCVRFSVSTASFSVLLLFNLLINWTIVREARLRTQVRFVLVFQLLLSALVHLGTSSVFYYQVHLDARPGRAACRLMVTVLISSASALLLTLTIMALDRYCAVCHPMRYTATCRPGRWPWLLGALTWLLALIIPLTLLGEREAGYGGECGPEQLRRGGLQKVLFIGLCTAVILCTYVRVLVEGRRLGVLNRRNRAGCRTIALHGSQLAVYILPNFVSFVLSSLHRQRLIRTQTRELSSVLVFAFFSLAQCFAPVVYGLRKEELLERVSLRFPCCSRYLKSALGWTVRGSWVHHHHPHPHHLHLHLLPGRERTLTAQTVLSLEVPQVPEQETQGTQGTQGTQEEAGAEPLRRTSSRDSLPCPDDTDASPR